MSLDRINETMNDKTPFAEILIAANAGKHPRNPGQWTPTACQVWRDSEPELQKFQGFEPRFSTGIAHISIGLITELTICIEF
jgi:hypothetical protein